MDKEVKGKKLLLLGATPNEIPLVRRAQELGIYVITTDYNLNYEISPAKKISDECWNISWSDLDTLEAKCREKKIDGIMAGYSEIRVDNLIKLCKRLELPCYITEEQLAITRDKSLFKDVCRKYDIPTIKEYNDIESVKKYPVIVKPTDRAGSIGVSVANSKQELAQAYALAMDKSITKKVIIEDYITNATEVDIHYSICDGKIRLLTTDDIIPAVNNLEDGKVVQSAWMYPSKYEKYFLNHVDRKLRKMIHGLGILNGTLFFSGFADSKGNLAIFECGYRLWGEQEFMYDYYKSKINYLDIYIYHALTGSTSAVNEKGEMNERLKGITLNIYLKAGTIKQIKGLNEIGREKDCFISILDSYIGQKCSFDNAILTKAALIGFTNDNVEALKEDVIKTYQKVMIFDQNGEDMIYDRIDADQIINWWD